MYTLSSSGGILKDDILMDAFLYRRLYIPQSFLKYLNIFEIFKIYSKYSLYLAVSVTLRGVDSKGFQAWQEIYYEKEN